MHVWPPPYLRGATRVTLLGAAASFGRGVGRSEEYVPRLPSHLAATLSMVTVGPTPLRASARTLTMLRTAPQLGCSRRFLGLGFPFTLRLGIPRLCLGGIRELIGDSGIVALCPW